jgi:polyisoprenoid-binding protein YceI
MKLEAFVPCHSDPAVAGEESLICFGLLSSNRKGQRCFASLNMTAAFTRGIWSSLITVVLIAGFSSAAAAKDIYQFDQSRSTIGFSVHQFLGMTRGKFTNFSGRIEVDREHPENSSVTAQIDVRSLDTRIRTRDDHLRSAEFFNVEKFPNMMFQSRSVKRTGPQSGDILGYLTMHGVKKPVTLHVKLLTPINETNRTRWAVTTDPINRREFNLMFAPATETISGISQTVTINIEIEAKRAE